MGLLTLGQPLDWPDAKIHADHVREHGITQLLNVWLAMQEREGDWLRFGDEIEFTVVSFDRERRRVTVSLGGAAVIEKLAQPEREALAGGGDGKPLPALWRPEYGAYMIEATPGVAYDHQIEVFAIEMESNMRLRRRMIQGQLKPNEAVVSIASFPRLGVGFFTDPPHPPLGPKAKSLYIPDQAIHPHPRFGTLTANIRQRRGNNVEINVPVFADAHTPNPLPRLIPAHLVKDESFAPGDDPIFAQLAPLPESTGPQDIHMDAMCFGMGCSCLQCTFQLSDVVEARDVYDQLHAVGAIMMAMTAASPIHRGMLSDIDVRWDIISAAVDDRSREERGLDPLKEHRFRIRNSRYATIDSYIGLSDKFKPKYEDIPLVFDPAICKRLTDAGMDERLARHFAHLFIRDPLVLFKERLDVDDATSCEHFENIQSTNWQDVRFKPPPPISPIGWRVEFRTMDVQPTDFENAAAIMFVVLLTRAILSFDLNLYLPLSLVDENMAAAHHRDACRNGKFWFRKHLTRADCAECEGKGVDPDEVELMSLNEIVNGKGGRGGFPGLLPMIISYLDNLPIEMTTRCAIDKYLELLRRRASGKLLTPAQWIRQFVRSHPEYKGDSVVSEGIAFDLVDVMNRVGNGEMVIEEVFGGITSPCDDLPDGEGC